MSREAVAGAAGPLVDVSLRNVSKRFGDIVAVDSIDFDIYDGEFFSLLGPSGCGNAGTILRIGSPLEGYEAPSSEFVAEFIGSLNVISLISLVDFRGEAWHSVLETALGTMSAVAVNDAVTGRWQPGDRLLTCWPEDAAVTLPSAG